MSNKKTIEKSLKSLILDDDRAFVAMLSGEWGIGKTYFWKHLFTDKELKKQNITYISLFGYSSIQNLKNDIVLKLSKTEQGREIFNKVFQNLKTSLGSRDGDESSSVSLSGSLVSSALSLIPEKSLQGSVVCFDDFERLSDKIDFKDVLGLISQFKEQKECKIIMILNEGELSESNQETFSRYKEKIVDYTFQYSPSQEELFAAIKEDIEKITFCVHQTIYNFFKKIDLKNIRIMKQALYQLNHFKFIKNYNLDEKVINEFVEISLNLFVFKAYSNYTHKDFNDMQGYTPYDNQVYKAKIYNDNEANLVKNEKHEKYFRHYDHSSNPLFPGVLDSINKTIIEKHVYRFMDNHTLNKENKAELQSLLEENNKSLSWYNVRNEISELHTRLCTDFSTEHNELINQLYTLLKTHKDDMNHLFHYDKFKSFIEDIKEFPPKESTINFEKEVIKNYIIFYSDNPSYDEKDYGGAYLTDIKSDYTWAKKFYDGHKGKALKIKDDAEIINLIKAINANHHYEFDTKNILTLVSPEKFQELIKKNLAFPEILVKFMRSKPVQHYMKDIIKNICDALVSLSDESDEYKWKVNQILKSTNINLEDYK